MKPAAPVNSKDVVCNANASNVKISNIQTSFDEEGKTFEELMVEALKQLPSK